METQTQKFAVVNSEGKYLPNQWFDYPNNFWPHNYTEDVTEAFFFTHLENAVKFADNFNAQTKRVKWNVQPVTV